MRFVLKVLAVLCALFCGLASVLSVVLVVWFWVSPRVETMPVGGKVVMFVTLIGIAAASIFGLVSTVRHLRRPDATTARQVCFVVLFLSAVQLISLIHGRTDRHTKVEWFGTATETLGSIAAGVAMVALYQFVLKGLAARSFPSTPDSHAKSTNPVLP